MSKCIAYCADGTWDTTSKDTNVYRMFKALPVTASQMPFYDDGVGADGNPISKVLGGAFGTGLWAKIKEGYTQIAQAYEAGDPLFLFGFSRGAYTARSLAGMIAACGLPTKDPSDDLVETAFKAYRDKDNRATLLNTLGDYGMVDAQITMVGVWDTVGSLGIPSGIGLVDPVLYGFLDTSLHPDVHNAYQAMALDEKRAEFPVTRWTGTPAPGQNVEQVWFTGVHSDVGGGEPDEESGASALADITLSWMIDRASALGLQVDPAVAGQFKFPIDPRNALDELHTSWNILWALPRKRPVAKNDTLANSVAIRCQFDETYRPSNLELVNGVPAAQYTIAGMVGQPDAAAKSAGQ